MIVSIGILVFTAAGVLIAYSKLRPNLKVRILECTHSVIRHRNPQKQRKKSGILIKVKLAIVNTGATTVIDRIGVKYKLLGQTFQTTERIEPQRFLLIEKGEMTEYPHQFYIPNCEIVQTFFACTFFLYHTYGKKRVKIKSIRYLHI